EPLPMTRFDAALDDDPMLLASEPFDSLLTARTPPLMLVAPVYVLLGLVSTHVPASAFESDVAPALPSAISAARVLSCVLVPRSVMVRAVVPSSVIGAVLV